MKRKIIFIIIYLLLALVIGCFIGIKLSPSIHKNTLCNCNCDETETASSPTNLYFFENIRLNDYFKIISSKDELNSYLNSITENKIEVAEDIANIKNYYENLDFNTNQLIMLRLGNSGCHRKIHSIKKLILTPSTITIELEQEKEKEETVSCNAYFYTVYTFTIKKGNYTNVEILR